ncbi:MAG: tyrosine-type recombinase/integrase, partial [Terracidiphilus sp.]
FHSYMRNCHGKRRLIDKGIFVPSVLLDRVDVDVISRDEYQEIRRRIKFRWPGSRSQQRRIIATCIAILGAAGMRREEARLLKIGDVEFEGWKEVAVRPSNGHTLKSESAQRKIPGEVIPNDDLAILQNWHQTRRNSGATDDDWLFESINSKCISPAIFRALNQIISEVTGTRSDLHSTHFHHMRKSFCSWGLLRLLLPVGSKPPVYMNALDHDWLIAGQNFRPNEIRRTDKPWNSDVFLMGQLLGHLQGITTMSRYFCFCGEILRVYLARSFDLSPILEQLQLAVKNDPHLENEPCSAQSAMNFAIGLLGNMANLNKISPTVEPSPSKNLGQEFLNKILDAWDLLSVIETPDNPVDEVAADFGIGLAYAASIQRAANDLSTLQTGNGEYRHRFMELNRPDSRKPVRSIIPIRPNNPFDNEIVRRFAPQIEELSKRSSKRELLTQGINSYVKCLWDSRGCPVFNDPENNGKAASAFLNLLYELKIADKNIRFGSFDCKGSESRRDWRTVLRLRKRRGFEPWEVPFKYGNSLRPWLGIKPTFGFETPIQSPGLFGFRFLMVMSYVVLRAETE